MSDDESEMARLRNMPKYTSLQMQKERMGNRMRNIAEKLAPKQEEDETGFIKPRSRMPGQKRDRLLDEPKELPQEFGKKYFATDPSEVHKDFERKNVDEDLMEAEAEEEEEDVLIGPAIPKETKEINTDKYTDYIQDSLQLPISHQAILKNHNKGVMALEIDPSGNRLITGANDYQVNFYDFQGMNQKLRPFRTLHPFEGYPITCLSFNNTGSNFLVSAGKSTVKVYTRDGIDVQETIKGDIYLRDMVHTRGHTEAVYEARWNPAEKNLFMTTSYDGTIRLWDLNSKHIGLDQNITYEHLMKLKTKNGMKSAGNTCCYSKDGELIVAGTTNGGIHIWHHKTYYGNPTFVNHTAHQGEVASICFMQGILQFFTRGSDNSMKVWDLRKFKDPVHVWDELPNESSRTQVSLSPDEKYVITPANIIDPLGSKGVIGQLVFCDTKTFDIVAHINMSRTHVHRVQWHPVINQLLVGCGDGATRILYDPEKSSKGIITALSKKAKTNVEDFIEYERDIITLDTIHKIKQNKPKPLRVAEMREDSKASHKPEEPLKGRLATNSITAFIMTQIHKNTNRDVDPREALLKYAKIAEENPTWVQPAYAKTQPKPIFDYTPPVRDEVKFMESIKTEKCVKCGQKFCACNKKLTDDVDLNKKATAK